MSENIIQEQEIKNPKSISVLKIIGTIIYIITTCVLALLVIIHLPNLEDGWDSLGYVLVVLVYSIFASVAYLAPLIMGIVGLVISAKKAPPEKKRGNTVYFIFMIVLPIITLIAFFLTIFLV